jgi:hypothetical protein
MAEEATGALSGAASGAAAGATFGPVGAVIGGVLGALGGIFGGKKKKKARVATQRANALDREATIIRNYVQTRAQLRQGQVYESQAIASAIASGVEIGSSAAQGIRGSIRTQQLANLEAGAALETRGLEASLLSEQAGRFNQQAGDIFSLMGAAAQIAGVAGKLRQTGPNTTTTTYAEGVNQSPFANQPGARNA